MNLGTFSLCDNCGCLLPAGCRALCRRCCWTINRGPKPEPAPAAEEKPRILATVTVEPAPMAGIRVTPVAYWRGT